MCSSVSNNSCFIDPAGVNIKKKQSAQLGLEPQSLYETETQKSNTVKRIKRERSNKLRFMACIIPLELWNYTSAIFERARELLSVDVAPPNFGLSGYGSNHRVD